MVLSELPVAQSGDDMHQYLNFFVNFIVWIILLPVVCFIIYGFFLFMIQPIQKALKILKSSIVWKPRFLVFLMNSLNLDMLNLKL